MISDKRFALYDRTPDATDLRAELLDGLRARPKRLSPKFFYDETGSKLFEKITALPEYYLTRTEIALIKSSRGEIARLVGDVRALIEYGSGGTRKIRLLLDELRPVYYVPVDISIDHLEAGAKKLHADYPWLRVLPVSADFTGPFELPVSIGSGRRLAFFPGSSIGNFEPAKAVEFLRAVASVVGPAGDLLIGVDRKKDPTVLQRAYDDEAGITRAFNLNALRHVNEAFGADFDLEAFEHVALYNEDLGCVQMFLESTRQQTVRLGNATVEFAAGERLHTENSFKYDPDEFSRLAARAGFRRRAWWTDAGQAFALFLLEVGRAE